MGVQIVVGNVAQSLDYVIRLGFRDGVRHTVITYSKHQNSSTFLIHECADMLGKPLGFV